MRKYIFPSILILLLGAGLSVAQTINKAIQLSQDATGAFGVDTNNGVYFPGHVLTTGTAPSVSSGATTPSVVGTDYAGTITVNAAATTVTATFAQAFVTAPTCLVSASNAGVVTNISWTTATTSLAITFTGAAGTVKPVYLCTSKS